MSILTLSDNTNFKIMKPVLAQFKEHFNVAENCPNEALSIITGNLLFFPKDFLSFRMFL